MHNVLISAHPFTSGGMKALLLLLVVLVGWAAGEPSVEQIEALLEWIRDLGGGVDGIRFQSVLGMGMGAVATRDLEAGTVITQTPLTALISLEHALATEPFGALSDELPQLSNANLKALFLAHEKKRGLGVGRGDAGKKDGGREKDRYMEERDGEKEEREIGNGEQEEEEEEIMEEVQKTAAEDETTTEEEVVEQRSGVLEEGKSFWQPYLDTLPSVLHTTLFFSEQELDDLQTSMVKEFAIKQQSAARKAYELVADVVDTSFPELKDITLEELKWGVSTWSSRAHNVRVKDKLGKWQIASCLVPLGDMFNMAGREEDVNVRCHTNEDSTHFECHMTTHIPTGKQVLAEYASKADKRHNGRLLMHYGFVLLGNPHNSVSIKFPELTHSVPHYRERKELAKKLLMKPFLQLTHPTSPSPTVNQLLQAVRLSQGSVPELQRASQLTPPFSLPLGPNSEQRVLKKAVDYLRNILSSYPTSLEQDVHILSSERLSTNSQLAVLLRSEEKRLLTVNMAHLVSLMTRDFASSDDHTHHHRYHKTEL